MQRLPDLIAASLPSGTVRLNTRVEGVTAHSVRTHDGELAAAAVVVATDSQAAASLTAHSATPMKALTTYWHTCDEPPSKARLLHLDADRRGPVVNTAVMTAVSPSYAPAGRCLVATTIVGADDSIEGEAAARRQAALIYGVSDLGWELVTRHVVPHALPVQPPPLVIRRPLWTADGVLVAGDHQDSASIQGALVSGRRAATAVLRSP
jgi:phytoene dehydrogenase-like protein